jgi:amino-acid N-acetyltransferase
LWKKVMTGNLERGDIVIRRATLADVEDMHRLINFFAGRELMLPKSRSQLYQNVRDFFVAEKDGQFAGCGALHILWGDLGEIRSLAVTEAFQGRGLGRLLANVLLHDAMMLKLPRVFALTYQREFFERLGFVEVDKGTMPQKVWGECMDCPKFPNCDEIAMVLDLSSNASSVVKGTPSEARAEAFSTEQMSLGQMAQVGES